MSARLHLMLDALLALPPLAQWRAHRFDAAFAAGRAGGSCRGVFRSFGEAAAAAPRTLPLGYDNGDAAAMYRDRLERVYPSDYAMMLWLARAWADGARRVFDLGGHVGIGYYAYQRYLDYPDGLAWQVHDVPAVMDSGRALAAQRDVHGRLTFAERFDAAAQADLLFSSGCLQYLEASLAEKLATLPRRPRWLLLNLLPLHDELDYWTVQSIGRAFCPYHIQRRAPFFDALHALGYRTLDVWENAEKGCAVSFEPGYELDRYHGAALVLER